MKTSKTSNLMEQKPKISYKIEWRKYYSVETCDYEN